MKFLILSLIFSSFIFVGFGQQTLKGKVIDESTGKELSAVSVYINNSSIGTTTSVTGDFVLSNFSVNKFDLIFSSIGYETYSINIVPENFLQTLVIKLKQKSAEMDAVLVQSYEKDGWEKWGKTFVDNLIGIGPNASSCEIVNNKVVKFVFDKKNQILTAYAAEPLIIKNKYLGYALSYDLQTFSVNFKSKMSFFSGYPFFTSLDRGERKLRKWKAQRKYAYEGSVLHFLRSIYRNALEQEGFEIRVLKRYANFEKQRVKKIYKSMMVIEEGNLTMKASDSMNYYQKILKESDSLDYVYPNIIRADSVAYVYDSTTAGLSFYDFLQVTHAKKKNVPVKHSTFQTSLSFQQPVSTISFIGEKNILIYSNGSYYDPTNLLTEGYWGWSEKLCNLLPIDYKVE